MPKGPAHVARLMAWIEDPASQLPESARAVFTVLIDSLKVAGTQIAGLDVDIFRHSREDPVARRLMTIPGIGPITATAITALVPLLETFRKGRVFAAWRGLRPLQKSTGGKQKLGAIPKMGERTLRRLLIIGNGAVVYQACSAEHPLAHGWPRCRRASRAC
jgi:transposase